MSGSWHGDAARCGVNLLFVGGMLLAQIKLRAATQRVHDRNTYFATFAPSQELAGSACVPGPRIGQ